MGVTVSFNPATIAAPGLGPSTMTITVTQVARPGTYPITVTGNGGGIKQTTTVTLTVIASGQPNFTISALPSSLSIAAGTQGNSSIYTTTGGGFNSAISLSAAGVPSGTTVSFNPSTIPAPGAGSSTMTITVGSSTPAGTYPITVTGNGGGIQQNATVTLTVMAAGGWQQGFDFRNTAAFVTDPPGDTYVLSTTAYPTKGNGVTYGWVKTYPVQGSRSQCQAGSAAGRDQLRQQRFASDVLCGPAVGGYLQPVAGHGGCRLRGNAGCSARFSFWMATPYVATLTEGVTNLGYFYDATGKNWSAATWPASNLSQQVTLAGTRLTMVVGTNKATGDSTPIAFLGVAQASGLAELHAFQPRRLRLA